MKATPAIKPGEVVRKASRRDQPLMEAAAIGNQAKSPFLLKRILVPIDFSDCCRKAFQYAIPLARQHQAAITLLHVLAPPTYAGQGDSAVFSYGVLEPDYGAMEAQMRADVLNQLSALGKNEVCDDVPSQTLVRIGSPALEIIEAARSLPADLVVISTHGRTGMKRMVLGSVAEQVVRRAPCPVLVVREREHEFVAV